LAQELKSYLSSGFPCLVAMSSQGHGGKLMSLRSFLQSRYSSFTDAFVALDVSNRHQISAQHFATGLRKMGFAASDVDGLYHAMDTQNAGSISLPMFLAAMELDSEADAPRAKGYKESTTPIASSTWGKTVPATSSRACPAVSRASSGGVPVRSHSTDAVNRQPTSMFAARSGSLQSRHTMSERGVLQSPRTSAMEPILLQSPVLTSGTPRILPRRSEGSPGPPGVRASCDFRSGHPEFFGGSLNLHSQRKAELPAGGSLNLNHLNTVGTAGRLTPWTAVRDQSAPYPLVGLGSVPAPTLMGTKEGRGILEQVAGMKAQLAAECMERQIDCRALRVGMDDHVRQLRGEVIEKSREEAQSYARDLRASLKRELDEQMTKAVSSIGLKLDRLHAQLRSASEDTETAHRSLEAQLQDRCDRLNELLTTASIHTEALHGKLEKDVLDMQARLSIVESKPVQDKTLSPSDAQLVDSSERLNRATEKRLRNVEAELERCLGGSLVIEGRIASLQESMSMQLTTAQGGALPEEKALERLETLEQQVAVLAEHTEDARQCCTKVLEPLADVQKLLADAKSGAVCTLPAVEKLLQAELEKLRPELNAIRTQQCMAVDNADLAGTNADQFAAVMTKLDCRLQAAEADSARSQTQGQEAVEIAQEVKRALEAWTEELSGKISRVEDRFQPQDSGSLLDFERRLETAEQSITQCASALEDLRAPEAPGPSCTKSEVQSLLEESLSDLTLEVQRLGKEDSLLEVGLTTLRGEIEKLTLQEGSQEARAEPSDDTISALDRRVQAGEETLGRVVGEWQSAMTDLQSKLQTTLAEHVQKQEKLLQESALTPTCGSSIDAATAGCYSTWTNVAMPCFEGLSSLTKPPPRARPRRKQHAGNHGNEPAASKGNVAEANSQHLHQAPRKLPPTMETESDGQVSGTLDTHLLQVISTLRSEVRRLREEQGLSTEAASSGAASPTNSTAASMPSNKVLPTVGPMVGGLNSVHGAPLPAYREYAEV